MWKIVLWTFAVLIFCSRPAAAADREVRARFDADSLAGGPFPSDRFTRPAPENVTGLAVHLPRPDCASRPSECEDIDVLNTLDGFSVQPRISIPFDGPIDPTSATSESIFLVRTAGTDDLRPIGINQVVWDTLTFTLHVQADEILEQQTSYVLIVTGGLRDEDGHRVKAASGWLGLGHEPDAAYMRNLKRAVERIRSAGLARGEIVSASLFTTQSVSSTLERIRDAIHANSPSANFQIAADGTRTVFRLSDLAGITWSQHTGANPARFTNSEVNLAVVRRIPGAVGSLAFGKYPAPDYQVHPGEFIPPVGTRATPAVQSTTDILFNLFLPASAKPARGWPVAIFAHGTGGSKNGRTTGNADGVLSVVATMASHGVAVLAINSNGHGYGPLGTLTVRRTDTTSVTFSSGGRSFDQNGDGVIGPTEGSEATAPRILQLNRDGQIQTISDLMQLVRAVQTGMDIDGDGTPDIDPARIYFLGHSLGSMAGIDLAAVEPAIRASVFSVPGGPLVENRRLGPMFRSGGAGISSPAGIFAARRPSLLNAPGIVSIDGVSVPVGPAFNENMPPREGATLSVKLSDGTPVEVRSPVTNTVAGAMELQEWFDRAAWAAQSASPAAFAVHLRRDTLPGTTARPVLFQFAIGDQASPNPNNMTILRAGDLYDRATFYRNDLAFAENSAVPKNPHGFLLAVASPIPLVATIARSAQEQAATFFESDGTIVIAPEPTRVFDGAHPSPSLENLNYIP